MGNVIVERTITSKIANEARKITNDVLKAIFTATL
jgi:hypothetical protein